MEKKRFAMFLIVDDEKDIRQLHLMCNLGEKESVWRDVIDSVCAVGFEEYPDLFSEICNEVN